MIDESSVQEWLDWIYSGAVAQNWKEQVRHARQEFRRDVLETLAVFDSSPELERRFDDLFDGSEVLPASLEGEYRQLLDEEPLNASSLLVPVTARQAARLSRENRLRRADDGVRVADVPYDSEMGLMLGAGAPEDV